MTTVYLIRHSIKEKNYGIFDSDDSSQVKNEKQVLSCEGEEKARILSMHQELQDMDVLWSSNYVRAIQTAKYIGSRNLIPVNISSSFDERHYGTFKNDVEKEEFWIRQFIDCNLKNEDGESQVDVCNRMTKKIEEFLDIYKNKRIAIVCHNACILFYLLQYCELVDTKVRKKLTICFRGKTIILDDIMESPSIMKLEFDDKQLVNLSYIRI